MMLLVFWIVILKCRSYLQYTFTLSIGLVKFSFYCFCVVFKVQMVGLTGLEPLT